VSDGCRGIDHHFKQLWAKETMDRLEAEISVKGMTVFARIDHAAGAAEVGLPLRPTELLIFGNVKGGTPLMQANQAIGIDLPLKALVLEDGAGDRGSLAPRSSARHDGQENLDGTGRQRAVLGL
jgi:uncharacterized protein (DUF302 family)